MLPTKETLCKIIFTQSPLHNPTTGFSSTFSKSFKISTIDDRNISFHEPLKIISFKVKASLTCETNLERNPEINYLPSTLPLVSSDEQIFFKTSGLHLGDVGYQKIGDICSPLPLVDRNTVSPIEPEQQQTKVHLERDALAFVELKFKQMGNSHSSKHARKLSTSEAHTDEESVYFKHSAENFLRVQDFKPKTEKRSLIPISLCRKIKLSLKDAQNFIVACEDADEVDRKKHPLLKQDESSSSDVQEERDTVRVLPSLGRTETADVILLKTSQPKRVATISHVPVKLGSHQVEHLKSGVNEHGIKDMVEEKMCGGMVNTITFCRNSQAVPNPGGVVVCLCDECFSRTHTMLSSAVLPPQNNSDDVTKGLESAGCSDPDQENKYKSLNSSGNKTAERFTTGDLDAFCEVVNSHLLNIKRVDEALLRESVQFLHQKWIEVVSCRDMRRSDLNEYFRYFRKYSDNLVKTLVYSVDNEGNNALHFAFGNNRFDLVEELLDSGYACHLLTQQNKLGHSPLMICSISKPKTDADWNIVQKAIQMGNINEKSRFSHQTPLMNASSRGYDWMVGFLLEAGADPNLQDKDGSTALMYASEHGHGPCVGVLLDHPDCDPAVKDCDSQTACLIALTSGYKDIAMRIYSTMKIRSGN